jgi:GMP synthase (glutamine-hydrolysing)
MLNILIAEGTPAVWQARLAGLSFPSNFSLLAAAVELHCPGSRCTPLNIADGEALPLGMALSDFDGVMVPGSPLHVYDPTPSVTRQIEFIRAACGARVPVWGSCWGLQVAAVALGGSVRRNPRGRELPIARAITVTEAGRAHPLLASRPAVFDALCSHIDEIETLPPNSQVLAANEVSAVQAIATETPWRGSFHGTQYHPEHTLAVSAGLMEIRAPELAEEGFGTEPAEIVAVAADYLALNAEPTRRDLIWRYGIASEILDPVRRTTEIGNWLRTVVAPRRFVAQRLPNVGRTPQRPSRRPLRSLLRMTNFLNAIKDPRHPEERRHGASRRTHRRRCTPQAGSSSRTGRRNSGSNTLVAMTWQRRIRRISSGR